ncbi:MAG: UvrB/UvrC motif-containing protein [Verrucomicrobiota bacterium]
MNFDISQILENWDYEPGQVVVRKFVGKDGREKIQLRVDIGILQMNAMGRPDGKRPFGQQSLLDHYISQLEKFREAHDGDDEGFALKAEDCSKLQQEAIQYHHRYICLFQLEDYDGVIRDTERNLEAFDFVQHYSESDEMAWALQQFRPQLLMMRVRARGAVALKQNNFKEVIKIIEEGLEEIRSFYREHSRSDLLDQSGEIVSLEAWLQEISAKRPLTEREKLETALDEAVKAENYEKAAKVRDALRNLKTS